MFRVNSRMSLEFVFVGVFPARCCFTTARRLAFSRVIVILVGTKDYLLSRFIRLAELTQGSQDPYGTRVAEMGRMGFMRDLLGSAQSAVYGLPTSRVQFIENSRLAMSMYVSKSNDAITSSNFRSNRLNRSFTVSF